MARTGGDTFGVGACAESGVADVAAGGLDDAAGGLDDAEVGEEMATEALVTGTLSDCVALCAWVAGLQPANAMAAAAMASSFGARTVWAPD